MNANATAAVTRIVYTMFPDRFAQKKVERAETWPEIVQRIKAPKVAAEKKALPLISLGTYGDLRTAEKNCLRHQANLRAITGVEGDYDGEVVPLKDAAERLGLAGVCAVFYTSPRHRPEAPRWRVLAPLSREYPPSERTRFLARVNGILGGILTGESFTLSQSFYVGRVEGREYQVIDLAGDCIDERDEFDARAVLPKGKSTANGGAADERHDSTTDADLRAAFERGEDRYQAMLKLSSRWAVRGLAVDDIEAALEGLLDQCPDSRNAEGVDLRSRVRGMAESAVRKFGESRTPDADWRAALALDRDKRPIPDDRNILLALRHAPELVGLTRFNEFGLCIEVTRAPPWRTAAPGTAWTDEDDTALLVWLQRHSISLRSRSAVADIVALDAKDRAVHPVRAYLDALQWDGQARLDSWLADYLDVKQASEYHKAIGRRFLVQAVARIMQPGVQADFTLVLEAPQGAGKSRTARALARRPEWFTDGMPNLHDKDAAIQLSGRWVVELAELAAIRRTVDIESTKAFLTRPVDVFRPPYARRAIPVPRQCVFIATTNQREYLRDTTGNRRYWPVRCGVIDLAALERDVDQLYAEAVAAYRAGDSWHLTAEETALATAEQDERRLVTELEKDVIAYLDRLLAGKTKTTEIDVRSVLIGACKLEPTKPEYVERAGRLGPLVVEAMNRAGWHKVRVIGRGENRRNVYVYAGPLLDIS